MNPKSFAAVGLVVSAVFVGHFAQGAVDRTVPVPSIVSTDAIAWFDAADFSTITADGRGVVSEWKDKSSGHEHTATLKSGWAAPRIGLVDGIPCLDFGAAGSCRDMTYTRMTDIRTAFFVGKFESNGNVFLLGDTSVHNFHRNGGNYLDSGYADRGTGSTGSKQARAWNGFDEVNPYSTALPSDSVQFVACEMYYPSFSDMFTADRSSTGRNGGRQLCEVILFNRTLSDAERKSVMTYLTGKWQGEIPSVNCGTEYAISAANELPGDAIALNFDDAGGTLTIDAAPVHDCFITCDGSVRTVCAPGFVPTEADLAKLHFGGVKGMVYHGWYKYSGRKLLAINFNKGKGDESADAISAALDVDMYGRAWKNVTVAAESTAQDLQVYDTVIQDFTEDKAKVTWKSSTNYQGAACPEAPFLVGYLDDGKTDVDGSGAQVGAQVFITDIPFRFYDVIVYSRAGDKSTGNLPIAVNGVLYTSGTDGIAVAGSAAWGGNDDPFPVWGRTAMVVKGQTGDFHLAGRTRSGSRGSICAIMIVERPSIDCGDSCSIGEANRIEIDEKEVILDFADGGTLIIDETPTRSYVVNCAGSLKLVCAPGFTPTEAELAKLHFSGVKGMIYHDWYKYGGRKLMAINFNSDKGAESADVVSAVLDVDMYGRAWKNVSDYVQETAQDLQVYDTVIQDFTEDKAKVTWKSTNNYQGSSSPEAPFLSGYLDDYETEAGTGIGAQVSITEIPFLFYDAIVYSRNGSANCKNFPVDVNGVKYTCGADGVGVEGSASWGDSGLSAPVWGKTAMVVERQTGDFHLAGQIRYSTDGRGPVSAVMIVERNPFVQLNSPASMSAVVAAIPENYENCEVELSFADGDSFAFDAELPEKVKAVRITCAGTLTLTGENRPTDWSKFEFSVGGSLVRSWFTPGAPADETLYWNGSSGWTNAQGVVTEVTEKTALVLQDGDNVMLSSAVAPAELRVQNGATARLLGYDRLFYGTSVVIPQDTTLELAGSLKFTANVTGGGTLCFSLGRGRELTTEQLDANSFTDFAGTIEMRSGRLHSPNNAPFAPSVRIVIRDNAQLYLHDGKTWANDIEVAGQGWQDNPVQPSAENAALRLDSNGTLSGRLTIAADTTITSYSGAGYLTGAVIATNGFTKIGSRQIRVDHPDFADVRGTVVVAQGELRFGTGTPPSTGFSWKFGDAIQVNAGGQLSIHTNSQTNENLDETKKDKVNTEIVLNGGLLWFEDGSYVVNAPLTVLSDSTIRTQYNGKGHVFTSLLGGEDVTLTLEQHWTRPFYAGEDSIWFLGGDFRGTISDVTSYGDPHTSRLGLKGDALANATVDLSKGLFRAWLWDSASIGCLTNTVLLGGVNGNHGQYTLTLNGGYLAGVIADDCNEAKDGKPGLNANRAIGLSLGGTIGLGAIDNQFSGTLTLRDGLVLVPTVADSKFVAKSVAMDPAAKVTIDLTQLDLSSGRHQLIDWSAQGIPDGVTSENFVLIAPSAKPRYGVSVRDSGLFIREQRGFQILIK